MPTPDQGQHERCSRQQRFAPLWQLPKQVSLLAQNASAAAIVSTKLRHARLGAQQLKSSATTPTSSTSATRQHVLHCQLACSTSRNATRNVHIAHGGPRHRRSRALSPALLWQLCLLSGGRQFGFRPSVRLPPGAMSLSWRLSLSGAPSGAVAHAVPIQCCCVLLMGICHA